MKIFQNLKTKNTGQLCLMGLVSALILSVSNLAVAQPSVAKEFDPAIISFGAQSTLTITLSFAGGGTLTAPFIDDLPAGLTFTALDIATTDCGLVLPTDIHNGLTSVTLETGSTIPAAGSCTITATVTSATPDTYVNTIGAGDLQVDQIDNTDEAAATLLVVPLSLSKAFDPTFIDIGAQSTLTITLNFIGGGTLDSDFTDTLPANLEFTGTDIATTDCDLVLPTDINNTLTSVTLNAGSSIPAGGSCTITATVTSMIPGTYVNTIAAGDLSVEGVLNPTPVSANLLVARLCP